MQDFRTLRVWQANRTLVVELYRLTADFPKDERFGITSQIRRAAISIGANLAEGCGRGSTADTLRFLQMAFGSATELLNLTITALDLGFITEAQFKELDEKLLAVRRMLVALMRRMKSGSRPRTRHREP